MSMVDLVLFPAIVGAGIGGTSCAFFLRQLLGDSANITVFEMGHVGGRLATIEMAGFRYEAGGSIIHQKNQLMKNLTKAMGACVDHFPEA